jgi:hypothetical protein
MNADTLALAGSWGVMTLEELAPLTPALGRLGRFLLTLPQQGQERVPVDAVLKAAAFAG